MPIQRYDLKFDTLSAEQLAAWKGLPPAIVSDCMNRSQTMSGRINPIAAGTVLLGQARTVTCMVGDNSAAHTIIPMLRPGEVLVIDGGGFEDTAVWGGIMTRAAMHVGCAGLVIDGAVRDVAEMRALGFKCFTRATVPAGPHKGFGGVIDGPISCGGCPVNAGDLIIGDDDGVCVVPLARQAQVLEASLAKIKQEEETNAATANGIMPGARMNLLEPEVIG
jgi:4-hydroxy-4-methyl-2-oxoglutarate aldolase